MLPQHEVIDLRSLRELADDSDGEGDGERLESDGLGDGLGEAGPGDTALLDKLCGKET